MTPFINLCSYVAMLSLAMLIFLIFLFRLYRMQGKDNKGIGLLIILFTILFLAGTILVGILYKG